MQQKQQEILKQVAEQPFIPKDPPPEFEFLADPPSISALDLDIVKLTAQFVARNGRTFLTNLMNREQRNFQFDFLRPQHSLFVYFTVLLKQYTKVGIASFYYHINLFIILFLLVSLHFGTWLTFSF